MKLIIDISEEDYKRCTVMASAIRNGIPLDDVKAEINNAYEDVTMYSCDEQVSCFASRVSEILASIDKESEE